VHKERNVHLSGVKFCKKQQLLFVAGTLSGKAYLYHMQRTVGPSGTTYSVGKREVLDLGLPGKNYINDVAISQDRAYFTDSFNPVLHWVPRLYSPSPSSSTQQRFGLRSSTRPIGKFKTGAFFDTKAGQFRANGIAVYKSNAFKDTLLVSNTHTGHLYKVVVDKAGADVQDAASAAGVAAAAVAVGKPAAGIAQIAQLSHAAQHATMAVASRLRLSRQDNPTGNSSSNNSTSTAAHPKPQKASGSGARNASTPWPVPVVNVTIIDLVSIKAVPIQAKQPPAQHTSNHSAAAGAVAKVAVAAAGAPAASTPQLSQPGRWTKLAQEVREELRISNLRKTAQQISYVGAAAVAGFAGNTGRLSRRGGAASPAQTLQNPHLISRLAHGVSSRMRRPGRAQPAQPAAAAAAVTNSSVPAAASNTAALNSSTAAAALLGQVVQGLPQTLGNSGQFSVQGVIEPFTGSNDTRRNSSSSSSTKSTNSSDSNSLVVSDSTSNGSSWQHTDDILLADPVRIREPLHDINTIATAAAAKAAAVAAAAAGQSRAFGRRLASLNVPGSQMVRGIAGRLRLTAPQQHSAALVQELPLPAIAGKYTQHLLVDGIAIKNSTAYVADNYNSRVWGVELDAGLSRAHVVCGFEGAPMQVPTTLTFQAGRLWWVNAHLDTCFPFLPCPNHEFELHGVKPSLCQPWSS